MLGCAAPNVTVSATTDSPPRRRPVDPTSRDVSGNVPLEYGVEPMTSIPARILELAATRGPETVFTHLSIDGGESAFTWAELHERSNQVAVALGRARPRLRRPPGPGVTQLPAVRLLRARRVEARRRAHPDPMGRPRLGVGPFAGGRRSPHLHQRRRPRLDRRVSRARCLGPPGRHLAVPQRDLQQRLDGHAQGHRQRTDSRVRRPCSSVPFMEAWAPVPRPQRILTLAPMYHTNGFATLFSLLTADDLVVVEKFDAARVVDAIERHRITTFTATPTMLQRIADLPDIDSRDLSSLVFMLQGAAPMPPSLVYRWDQLIGADRIVMVVRHDRGARSDRAPGRRVDGAPGQCRARLPRAPRSRSSTRTSTRCRTARSARSSCGRASTAATDTWARRPHSR